MDKAEQSRRWETAQEHRQAAEQALAQQLYRASVSRSYYACYQAMWVALGDPPRSYWKHGGIAANFCRGRWADPVIIPTSLAVLYQRLLNLYELRLDADYRAVPVTSEKAQEAVETVHQVLHLVEMRKLALNKEEQHDSDS
jgi:uncharacterized protein (UPF0332 family)